VQSAILIRLYSAVVIREAEHLSLYSYVRRSLVSYGVTIAEKVRTVLKWMGSVLT
jgi:hypothetical protein